jgi:hypothetical protein
MIISKKYLSIQIVGISLILIQFIPILNYISTLVVFLAINYFYYKGKYEYSLFLMLLFSAFITQGVNIYIFKIFGFSLFYLSLIIMILISINKNKEKLSKIPRILLIYTLFVSVLLLFSVSNIFDSLVYFIKDFLMIYLDVALVVILFKDIYKERIFFVFYNIIAIKIISSLIMYWTGFTMSINEDMFNTLSIENSDEIGSFYIVLLLGIVLFSQSKNNKWYLLLLIISILGILSYGLGFVGLGSQVMLMIIIVLIFYTFTNKKYLVLLVFAVILFLNTEIENKTISYKIKNISELFLNLNEDSIYLIPHSPQVRVIEIINIMSYPWYYVVFGHGIGGHFTDKYFEFNKYIGKYDFSEIEINSRKFYYPHNFGYGLMKFGLIWYVFLIYLLFKASKIKCLESKMFILLCIMTVWMNLGYGAKNSILLAIILIMLNNRGKSFETKN